MVYFILKPTGLPVLKAHAEIMCYKFQNKFTVFELEPFKSENSEKLNQVKVFPAVFHNVFIGKIFAFK